ncbi:glycoside hydrolase [Coccomyxa subellipsoidea C-169]|uniref:mannan endo-1,4-beta-mannosidase n=1 Tax=Coccomyxa subellipsoidea (strain C-169) TaxID=574566 RepID=I0YQ11_COCSC|nr:glycoside hydrolase [Coccomyxa subellipsoidea C-169]EIE20480.1 glycoside hydrolase [Coccomyxa subellipsoidea C-169]|eukprot:XP_005645024.1 glycoside hydrolase [Coccomyxa subellipsoidea C-169]
MQPYLHAFCVYNETAFRGLDFVLDQASHYGVKVMFTLTNNWKTFDSKYNYVKWANQTDLDAFWTDAKVKRLFKNHIYAMTSRINVYNGRRYRDDPAIFGWDLINEPRCNCFPSKLPPSSEWDTLEGSCSPTCANKITAWVHEMAAYLKEKDPNHLVTVGLEGFWGAHAPEALEFNPLPGDNGELSWTSLTGQNFTAQHDSPHIDFCAAHYWPDLWVGNENQAFLSKWIDSHAGACKAIGKPFVLEEFGKNVTAKAKTPEEWKARRTPMFSHAYSEYISSLESGGNYQGTMFWKWALSPKNPRDDFLTVAAPDPTFTDIVVPGAKSALEFAKRSSPLQNCVKVVTKQDSSALRTDAWDRTLSDWLRRADEANHEVAVEAKRNHTHHVHSVLGGKSILTDTEITMPEDDLASQVNDTELMPALSTAFSDEAASASSEGLETIFDAQRAQRAADAEIAAAESAATEAAKADAADAADDGAPAGDAQEETDAADQKEKEKEKEGQREGSNRGGLEEEAAPSENTGQERAARLAARASVRARKTEQEAEGDSGQQPGSQDPVPSHHRHAKSVQTDDSNAMAANPQTAANLQAGCTEGAARNGGRR